VIQHPRQGELIVGVPSAGTLLSHQRTLNACFDRMLAAGHEDSRDGTRVIVWHVEGRERVPQYSPVHGAAVQRLGRCVERLRSAAAELRAALDENPRATDIEIGPLAQQALGAVGGDGRTARLARGTTETLQSICELGALAVEHALKDPVLFADDRGGVSLACWACLPPRAGVDEPREPAPISPPPPPPPQPEAASSLGADDGLGREPDPPTFGPKGGRIPDPTVRVDPEPPPIPPATEDAPRRPQWIWWLLGGIALLLLALLLAWLLFPGVAFTRSLDQAFVAPSLDRVPQPRSEEERRRGTIDLELPPPPRERELIFVEFKEGRNP
jgi:hypothetical protein